MSRFIIFASLLMSACSIQGPVPGGDPTFVPGYDYNNDQSDRSKRPTSDSYGADLVPQ